MSVPVLTPKQNPSPVVLPATGTYANVAASLPFGMYTSSVDFLSGAATQVAYTYRKLGGDVLDIELTANNVYANFEEAVLEYSYLVNTHQAKNILSTILGAQTGTFDHRGEIKSGSLSSSLGGRGIELRYPQIRFEYARRFGNATALDAGLGGTVREYSASIDIQQDVQDYNLQAIVSSSAAAGNVAYSSIDRNTRIIVNRVFYKTPRSMWRFYGYYGGLNVVGNLTTYGQYADDSTFEVIPVWQNKLQAMNFEDMLYTRTSHFSYELRDNYIRIFPMPVMNEITKMWFTFQVLDNSPWTVDEKSLSKETLGQIRGKFGTIPIPGENLTLNASALLSQAQAEQTALRDELKTVLDEMVYSALAEKDAATAGNVNTLRKLTPLPIFQG